jgi:hypothetical protein
MIEPQHTDEQYELFKTAATAPFLSKYYEMRNGVYLCFRCPASFENADDALMHLKPHNPEFFEHTVTDGDIREKSVKRGSKRARKSNRKLSRQSS